MDVLGDAGQEREKVGEGRAGVTGAETALGRGRNRGRCQGTRGGGERD